jgi:phosphate:Na+ symporter
MTLIVFLTELAGATVLLLYAVRMVRTGIERAFGSSFRRVVMSTGSPLQAALTGLVMGVVLQSSAAVGLLVAGFSGAGGVAFGTGLSIMLGGDLGKPWTRSVTAPFCPRSRIIWPRISLPHFWLASGWPS